MILWFHDIQEFQLHVYATISHISLTQTLVTFGAALTDPIASELASGGVTSSFTLLTFFHS